MTTRAIVVFEPLGVDEFLSRLLRPGFKHVFVALESDQYWIRIDGQAGTPSIQVVAPSDYDLAEFYREQGNIVVETHRRPHKMPPLVHGNCVGMVKAVLGLRSWAITPWQLYRRLVP